MKTLRLIRKKTEKVTSTELIKLNLYLNFQLTSESKAKQFLFAAENNDIKTLENLYSENPNVISCVDSDGYTPLHRACYEGHIDAVKV